MARKKRADRAPGCEAVCAQKKSPTRKAAAKPSARKKLEERAREHYPGRRGRSSASPSAIIVISRISEWMACAPMPITATSARPDQPPRSARRTPSPIGPCICTKFPSGTITTSSSMVYAPKGWVKSYIEGVGDTLMQQGSALHPAAVHLRHRPGLFR